MSTVQLYAQSHLYWRLFVSVRLKNYLYKILFYKVYRWGSHAYSTPVETDYKLLTKKMYLNIIYLLNYISVYAKLLRPYKLLTRLYLYRMSYRSFFDFKVVYHHYFPPGKCMSMQYFYKRLMISRFDPLMFTINYFFMDRLKIIDYDFRINYNQSNIISDMRHTNYFRHTGIMFLDYLTKSYYLMQNEIMFRQRSSRSLLHFMFH